MQAKPAGHARARVAWTVLSALLLIEAVGGAALLFSVLRSGFAASEDPLGQRLSIVLAALLAFVWIAVTAFGALVRRAGWARGSALTLHVLMFAAGTGVLQYRLADPLLGWALALLALAGFFAALMARGSARQDADEEAQAY